MSRENKKEAVAALHREQIMKAAEKLFLEKGYAQTTIENIQNRLNTVGVLFMLITKAKMIFYIILLNKD